MYLWWIQHFSVCTMSPVDHHSRVILRRPRLCRQWPRGAPFPGARCRGRAVPPPPSRRLSRRPRSLSQGARQNPPVLRQRPGPVMPWHPISFKNELCGPGRPDLCPLLTCGPHFERPAPCTWPSLPFFAWSPPACASAVCPGPARVSVALASHTHVACDLLHVAHPSVVSCHSGADSSDICVPTGGEAPGGTGHSFPVVFASCAVSSV